jgi:hypothetical protein
MYLPRLLLAIYFGTLLGTSLELLFLEHYEDVWQYAPLVAAGLGFAVGAWYARSPTIAALRAFKSVLGLFVVTGIAGLVLHYRANVEFEVERDSRLGGMRLVWEALGGAMPALAPGTMMLLAAIGYAVIVSRRQPLASARS